MHIVKDQIFARKSAWKYTNEYLHPLYIWTNLSLRIYLWRYRYLNIDIWRFKYLYISLPTNPSLQCTNLTLQRIYRSIFELVYIYATYWRLPRPSRYRKRRQSFGQLLTSLYLKYLYLLYIRYIEGNKLNNPFYYYSTMFIKPYCVRYI